MYFFQIIESKKTKRRCDDIEMIMKKAHVERNSVKKIYRKRNCIEVKIE